jgi:ubiquinone biosynthesis protein
VEWASEDLKKLRRELHTANRRSVAATLAAGSAIAAALIYGLDGYAPMMLGNAPALTWLFGTVAVAFTVAALRSGE